MPDVGPRALQLADLRQAMRKHRRLLVQVVIPILLLCVVFAPSLIEHAATAADPLRFNDDSRMQIWQFQHYRDSSLFADDYVAQAYLHILPQGYVLMYRAWSALADPRVLSKILPYLLLPVLLVAVGVTAGRLGGAAAGWCAIALCLSSSLFLLRMTGGLPRAFGFPLIGAAAMALVLGRPTILAVVVCVAAAFYPVVGFLSGLTLAAYLLALPGADRGEARDWTLGRRLAVVCLTAGVSVLILWPGMRANAAYGPWVRPHQVSEYPEAGPGGRFVRADHPPYRPFTAEARILFRQTLVGHGKPWPAVTSWMRSTQLPRGARLRPLLIMVVATGLAGTMLMAMRNPAVRRLLLLPMAAVVAHIAAVAVAPSLYVPSRYASFAIPVLTVILLPVGGCALGRLLARAFKAPERAWMQPAAGLLLCGVCVFGLGSRGDPAAGLNIRIDPNHKIYAFLESLPHDAMIAGWPHGLMDNVPYLCKRRALLTYETHVAFHRRYLEEMRRRMTALLSAYYAIDSAPVISLRDQFGVTHLVLDRRHYAQPPAYFKPYNPQIREAFEAYRTASHETPVVPDRCVVFREGPIVVLDLSRIGEQLADDGDEKRPHGDRIEASAAAE